MSRRLSNPFDYTYLRKTKITEELLQECQENPSFQNLMERLIEADKEKYMLIITRKGVRLPEEFDTINFRKVDEQVFRTMS